MASVSSFVDALRKPSAYPHPVGPIACHETHISWVLTTGEYAYKLKKPVALPFVDFSTLQRREHFCREELRLNRRMAPEIYLDVVPVTGTPDEPKMNGTGRPFEWAVRMRQFAERDRLDRALAEDRFDARHLRDFGMRLADFHASADCSQPCIFGSSDAVRRRISANLSELAAKLESARQNRLRHVESWLARSFDSLAATIDARAAAGRVRECHGDMHLGNLVLRGGTIVAFDCIEFDEALRRMDVVDDIAFPVMDLEVSGRPDLSSALLDAWLQANGDYESMLLLPFYTVARALVRAKIAAIERESANDDAPLGQRIDRLLGYAERPATPQSAMLLLTHGLPASGKSRIASALIDALPGLRISSDVERKRLAGIGRYADSGSGPGTGLYTDESNYATYARLREAAEAVLRAGRSAIVDASFARRCDRERFYELARELGSPVRVVSCTAPAEELERRIERRSRAPAESEADLAILAHARKRFEPVDTSEAAAVVEVDTTRPPTAAVLAGRLRNGSVC